MRTCPPSLDPHHCGREPLTQLRWACSPLPEQALVADGLNLRPRSPDALYSQPHVTVTSKESFFSPIFTMILSSTTPHCWYLLCPSAFRRDSLQLGNPALGEVWHPSLHSAVRTSKASHPRSLGQQEAELGFHVGLFCKDGRAPTAPYWEELLSASVVRAPLTCPPSAGGDWGSS